ncbi:MAG: gamma-butyrobetaine hydroxylase-like domain-containing protein [Hyphomonadaceae bacterium]
MMWPTELRFAKKAQTLSVTFNDGTHRTIGYKELRAASPSAENKGHGNGPPPPQPPIPDDIDVTGAAATGRYAVRIEFSDGHRTGLYTWDLLATLGA